MVSRFQEVDLLRSIAIILIIFAHVDSFTNLSILERLDGTSAVLGLSIFFFISGFLMQRNNKFTTERDLYLFIKKRMKKIYPLYWLSIVVTYIMDMIGFDVLYSENISANKSLLLLNILGLQGFFSENYSLSIWWFIGVILLYYFIFSLILYHSKGIRDLLTYSFFAILPFIFLKNEYNLININVFIFYFVFIAGILSSTAENLKSLKTIVLSYCILLFSFLLMPYFGMNIDYINDMKHNIIFLSLLIFFPLYKIKSPCEKASKLPVIVKKIADSSYSIYLFHIPVLTLFKLTINLIIPENTLNLNLNDYLTLFLGVPFTLYSGYCITVLFNKYCEKLFQLNTPLACCGDEKLPR